jgi:hypothetical protein
MAFNITDFTSRFQDGARPNLFEVRISDLGEGVTFLAKSAALPGSTIGVIELPYFGRAIKLAGNRTFAEWTVTIINDEDFAIRSLLEERMAVINGHETNTSDGPITLNDYSFRGEVIQYARSGDELITYTFENMFPTDISQIDLDWGSNDMIEEYTVTFAYQYFTSSNAALR